MALHPENIILAFVFNFCQAEVGDRPVCIENGWICDRKGGSWRAFGLTLRESFMLKRLMMAAAITVAATAASTIGASAASHAKCGIEKGRVSILGNEFPAIQTVVAGAAECASDTVTVTSNLTKDHRDLQVSAMTANPAEYTSEVVLLFRTVLRLG